MYQKLIRNVEILDKTENGELKATLMPLKHFSRVVYTRVCRGQGCACALLPLVLFQWKRHNKR